MKEIVAICLAGVLVLTGCEETQSDPAEADARFDGDQSAIVDASGGVDGRPPDAAAPDGGRVDAHEVDSRSADTGLTDSGAADARDVASPTPDAHLADSQVPDTRPLLPDARPSPQPEICDGLDNDLDGQTDEGADDLPLTRDCYSGPPDTVGVGLCRGGLQTCRQGVFGPCTDENGPAGELCDGLDNDCNGIIDDPFDIDRPCQGQLGACGDLRGQWECAGPNGARCSVDADGSEAGGRGEICNGLDDDCDGDTDEETEGQGGACATGSPGQCEAGTVDCQNSQILCVPSHHPDDEICDGIDNDCDGETDESDPTLGTACQTGRPGVCAGGTILCQDAALICAPDTEDTQEVCDGLDNDCDGFIDEHADADAADPDDRLNRPCYDGLESTVDVGLCRRGTQTCVEGQYGPCTDQRLPQPERCNGDDDNCDGEIDEQFVTLGEPCSVGLGPCQRTGEIICAQSAIETTCSVEPGPPAPAELCGNALDDDCDGDTDEGFERVGQPCTQGVGACQVAGTFACRADNLALECPVAQGQPTAEACDGLDNDCDGAIDEDFDIGLSCTIGQGACAHAGQLICHEGGDVTLCDAEPADPPGDAELCGNEIDDDCDGDTDEGFDTRGAPCAVGVGACGTQGALECSPDGLTLRCTVEPGEPHLEVCDGIDNDCNGEIDEGFDTAEICEVGAGACRATGRVLCVPDGFGATCDAIPGVPAPEICGNGIDDDCDGETDEAADEICDGVDNDCDDAIDQIDQIDQIDPTDLPEPILFDVGPAGTGAPSLVAWGRGQAAMAWQNHLETGTVLRFAFINQQRTLTRAPVELPAYLELTPRTNTLERTASGRFAILSPHVDGALALVFAPLDPDGQPDQAAISYGRGAFDGVGNMVPRPGGFWVTFLQFFNQRRLELLPVDALGQIVGDPVLIDPAGTNGAQLAADPHGLHVIWDHWLARISYRRFNADGVPTAPEIVLEEGEVGYPAVATHGAGALAVWSMGAERPTLRMGLINAEGRSRGPAQDLPGAPAGTDAQIHWNGELYLVVWRDNSEHRRLQATLIDPDGQALLDTPMALTPEEMTIQQRFSMRWTGIDYVWAWVELAADGEQRRLFLNRAPLACPSSPLPCTEDDATCDGIDDDCDGLIDEDHLPTPITCGQGACNRPGTATCRAGRLIDHCTPDLPRTERCGDRVDDDCDGQIDEITPELCDGADNDCDGLIDEVDPLHVQLDELRTEAHDLRLAPKEDGVWALWTVSPSDADDATDPTVYVGALTAQGEWSIPPVAWNRYADVWPAAHRDRLAFTLRRPADPDAEPALMVVHESELGGFTDPAVLLSDDRLDTPSFDIGPRGLLTATDAGPETRFHLFDADRNEIASAQIAVDPAARQPVVVWANDRIGAAWLGGDPDDEGGHTPSLWFASWDPDFEIISSPQRVIGLGRANALDGAQPGLGWSGEYFAVGGTVFDDVGSHISIQLFDADGQRVNEPYVIGAHAQSPGPTIRWSDPHDAFVVAWSERIDDRHALIMVSLLTHQGELLPPLQLATAEYLQTEDHSRFPAPWGLLSDGRIYVGYTSGAEVASAPHVVSTPIGCLTAQPRHPPALLRVGLPIGAAPAMGQGVIVSHLNDHRVDDTGTAHVPPVVRAVGRSAPPPTASLAMYVVGDTSMLATVVPPQPDEPVTVDATSTAVTMLYLSSGAWLMGPQASAAFSDFVSANVGVDDLRTSIETSVQAGESPFDTQDPQLSAGLNTSLAVTIGRLNQAAQNAGIITKSSVGFVPRNPSENGFSIAETRVEGDRLYVMGVNNNLRPAYMRLWQTVPEAEDPAILMRIPGIQMTWRHSVDQFIQALVAGFDPDDPALEPQSATISRAIPTGPSEHTFAIISPSLSDLAVGAEHKEAWRRAWFRLTLEKIVTPAVHLTMGHLPRTVRACIKKKLETTTQALWDMQVGQAVPTLAQAVEVVADVIEHENWDDCLSAPAQQRLQRAAALLRLLRRMARVRAYRQLMLYFTHISINVRPVSMWDFSVCRDGPEICENGLDEDCDGVADNGCDALTER